MVPAPGPSPSPARRPFSQALARELSIALFFVALAGFATRPLAAHFATATIAGYDPLSHLWTVHWLVEHFGGRQMFEGNLFFPARHAVLFTDIDLGSVVLVLPFRGVLHDPVPLLNLAVLGALAFGAWSVHALVRDLTGRISAGLLTGILVGFGSNPIRHLPHLNLLSTGWLALFLLGLHRLEREPGVRSALLAGIAFSLAAQSSGYYAAAAVLLALLFAVVHARRLAERRRLGAVAAAVLVAALLTAPYASSFCSLRRERGLHRGLGWSGRLAFHPSQDLGSQSYLYGAVLGRRGECLFPGLLCLGLAPLALVRRAPGARFYAAAVVVLAAFSLPPSLQFRGRDVWLPFAWIHSLPPFDSLRHPYTFAAVAVSALGVLAGLGLATLPFSRRAGPSTLVLAAAVLEIAAPPPALQAVPRGLPPVYERLAALPAGSVLEVPNPDDDGSVLVSAARSDRPFLNGQFSAYVPEETRHLYDFIAKEWLRDTPEEMDLGHSSFLLDNYPVRYLVVRRPHMGALGRALDRSPYFQRVAETADGDRIYEVVRPGSGGA